MQRTICSVLDVAKKAGVTSLAMPLLGCGVAGLQIPLVAEATIKEVLNMAKNGSTTGTVKVSVFGVTRIASWHQHITVDTSISMSLCLC